MFFSGLYFSKLEGDQFVLEQRSYGLKRSASYFKELFEKIVYLLDLTNDDVILSNSKGEMLHKFYLDEDSVVLKCRYKESNLATIYVAIFDKNNHTGAVKQVERNIGKVKPLFGPVYNLKLFQIERTNYQSITDFRMKLLFS